MFVTETGAKFSFLVVSFLCGYSGDAPFFFFFFFRTSLVAHMEKNKRIHSSVQYLGREDPWRRGRLTLQYSLASLVAQIVKYLPAMREIWV